MAGTAGRNVGWNKLSTAEHTLRGTLRRDRHALPGQEPPGQPVSPSARRRVLRGLPPAARRMAASLLAEYSGWDQSGLQTLRAYALSSARLEALQAATPLPTRALHAEVRCNPSLLKMLNLEIRP